MIKQLTLSAALVLGLGSAAHAAGGAGHVEDINFSFEGPFGTFDQLQLQRGLQIYTDVCAACHGLKFVPIRTLSDPGGVGLPADQVRAYARDVLFVADEGANAHLYDFEEGAARGLLPTDNFPAVENAGAPDLSLMAKARAGFHGPAGTGLAQLFQGMGGAEYIYSLLTGYTGKTKEEAGTTLYENTAFPGGWISMAPPLEDGRVEFDPEHANDLHHLSEDISAFLMWTAEPKMMARQQAGFVAVLFLALLTVLLYLTNKKIWAPVKRAAKGQPAE
ncbi:ubiquinol cytochrome C oxidoreductase, cytochrome C1 subunit [Candidatus Rhodobacter oscarellae]|uniref:Cytochrome c1 n=1 Tax=Candidatus Rhodobacter oscarellae TaxID=1675527 RepID=A0A0J9ECE3_9RHOB|nr:cytochrome c1 [Candidatus Rhodobacter lobularis]KMW60425.1 ubiquinol cytochrome C oxidoreductase, cytochrome C1 subunit [Candidatus Rhodobacter lobularis]